MRTGLALAVIALLPGCAFRQPSPSDMQPSEQVLPICQLPEVAREKSGSKVQVRGRMRTGAHEIFLTDHRCQGVALFLESVEGGADITLCGSDVLSTEFGCPGGNDNGPVVTVTGVLRTGRDRRYSWIRVEDMEDFRRVAEEYAN